jgi:hypothetical protein
MGFLGRWWDLRRRHDKWGRKSWWGCRSKSTAVAATVARDDELPVASLHSIKVRKVGLSELRLAVLRRNVRFHSNMLKAVVRRLTTVDANMSKSGFALGSKLMRVAKLKSSVVPTEVGVVLTCIGVIKPDGKSVSSERLHQIEGDCVVRRRHNLNVLRSVEGPLAALSVKEVCVKEVSFGDGAINCIRRFGKQRTVNEGASSKENFTTWRFTGDITRSCASSRYFTWFGGREGTQRRFIGRSARWNGAASRNITWLGGWKGAQRRLETA